MNLVGVYSMTVRQIVSEDGHTNPFNYKYTFEM